MRFQQSSDPATNQSRRALLKLFPWGIAAAVFGSIATAAFRFLRPVVSAPAAEWIDVAPVDELTGVAPIPRTIIAEQIAGWAASPNEHTVYVLPQRNEVLSSVCPHEGCEVAWDASTNHFSCPCHDSFFAVDGTKVSGPAGRGLDPLPTRVQAGKLQIQFRFFENNSRERITRA